MEEKKIVIGIGGCKNSGKDTIASMINYIDIVGTTKATYDDWCNKGGLYDKCRNFKIGFADKLKKALSIIYNIDLEHFYSREYKDNKYYCLIRNIFIEDVDLNNCRIIEITDLEKDSLNRIIKNNIKLYPVLKLRTLLQYFGTNICRTYLDDNIWTNSTINEIEKKFTNENVNLITINDLRFNNELVAINNIKFADKIITIKINRNVAVDNHSSENEELKCDYIIDNNSTKLTLFYKVLNILKLK